MTTTLTDLGRRTIIRHALSVALRSPVFDEQQRQVIIEHENALDDDAQTLADSVAVLKLAAARATVARDALLNIRDLMDANRANRDRPFLWREIQRITDEALSEFP